MKDIGLDGYLTKTHIPKAVKYLVEFAGADHSAPRVLSSVLNASMFKTRHGSN